VSCTTIGGKLRWTAQVFFLALFILDRFKMKKILAFVLFTFFGVGNLVASITTTSDDLWDISQGAVVTNNSAVLNWGGFFTSNIDNLFGFTNTRFVEPTETIFGNAPKGFVHWVEWQTPTAITLRSFVMDAGHDGNGRDANARGFSRFSLYAFNDSANQFESIFELFPSNPYNTTVSPSNSIMEFPSYSTMLLAANVNPTTASRFRAEFVQFGDSISSALGPRIRELDGFDTFRATLVPEPTAASIWGLLLGVGCWAFRRKDINGDINDTRSNIGVLG